MTTKREQEKMQEVIEPFLAGIRSGHLHSFIIVAVGKDPGANEFFSHIYDAQDDDSVSHQDFNIELGKRVVRLLGCLAIAKSWLTHIVGFSEDLLGALRKPKPVNDSDDDR